MDGRLDPDDIPEDSGATAMVGWLAEGLLRDWLKHGAVLFGLITIGAGVSSSRPVLIFTGVVVGALGAVLPFVADAKRWVRSTQWCMVLVLLAAEVALIWAVWG